MQYIIFYTDLFPERIVKYEQVFACLDIGYLYCRYLRL